MTDPFPLPLGYVLHFFDLLPSSMDEAHALAKKGAPEGTIVLASRQTKGRGRLGKQWISLPGNLSFSILFKPKCSLQEATALSFILAISIGQTLSFFCPQEAEISYKWPNDVLLYGRKVAGILLETETSTRLLQHPEWVVGGVGVNLAQYPPTTDFPATALATTGTSLRPSQFLSSFCLKLTELLELWRSQGFSVIRELWLKDVWGLHQELILRKGKEELWGTFEDIDLTGALVIKDELGDKHTVSTGEIVFPSAFI